jgi:hypothetical protein
VNDSVREAVTLMNEAFVDQVDRDGESALNLTLGARARGGRNFSIQSNP